MPLAVGTKAPDFMLSTKAADGPKQIKLSDNFGKKNTLLLFFPMAFTGTCTTEMCEVSAGLNAYTGLNANVYGISGDNPFAQEAWAQKEKITVPLLSDYEHKIAGDYGVMYESDRKSTRLNSSHVANTLSLHDALPILAFTGTCTTEMCEVSAGLNAYTGLNANVYGISGDNPFAQEAWAQKEKITVPLLSDYEHKIAGDYGVMYE